MDNWKSLAWITGLTAFIMSLVLVWDFLHLGASLTWAYALVKCSTILTCYAICIYCVVRKQTHSWQQDVYGLLFYAYSLYGMIYIDMTYAYSFIEAFFILSLCMTVSLRRYLTVNLLGLVASGVGHWYAVEPKFVAAGESFKSHSFVFVFIVFLVLLVTHLAITRFRTRIFELNQRFALIGKQSSFLMHEIKTPLNRVVLNSEEEMNVEMLAAIRRDSSKISALVNSVETLIHSPEKIASTFHSFNWEELRENLKVDFDSYITAMNMDLEFENVQGSFYGNKHLMYQLLKNNILNAIEAVGYNKEKRSLITVTIASNTDSLKLSVTNTNSFIPAKNIGQIFEPHFTTKPSLKNRGLGLALVKTIVEAHGGKISVHSANEVTQFDFILPLKTPSHSAHS